MKYYIDSCIWLNLFKKEEKYCSIAEKFIQNTIKKKEKIAISKHILTEIKFRLNGNFHKIEKYFEDNKTDIVYVKTIDEDYNNARKIESENKYQIGFYDCLHISICKRLNLILITRDRDLIRIGSKYIKVKKPEYLIHTFSSKIFNILYLFR